MGIPRSTYQQLEFDKLRKIIAAYCDSLIAKERALKVSVLSSKEEMHDSLEIISECQEILSKGYVFGFGKITGLNEMLFRYKYEAYSYDEFNAVYRVLIKASEVKQTVDKEGEFFAACPNFIGMTAKLVLYPVLVKRFETIFTGEGEVSDNASPELKRIRTRQFTLRKNILDKLERKINDKGLENIVQDKIITQREGRYVIPLKDGGLGTVPGIVHGYSGSRATIFVEPNDIVNQNNELHTLKRDEEEEIYRIFKEFTGMIKEVKEDIFQDSLILTEMDFFFGCAKMSNLLKSTKPQLTDDKIVKLFTARHPLLIYNYQDVEKVIPFDLTLGDDKKMLILSGPNTGGKTITLKTVGLMVLMALCGLPLPAGEGTQIGSFENLYTDISDEQSIENSLSTFSSHIEKIKQMLHPGRDTTATEQDRDESNISTGNTLVLIDEIGSATDPEQGSALAQAILEKLIERQVLGLVTTHYTPLKVYAESSEYCVNAAMQFDPQKHQPTYIFQIGLPGNSFALEIASKLGLDKEVLSRAEELAGKNNVELTNLITTVSVEKKELSKLKYRYEMKERLLEMKIKEHSRLIGDAEAEKKEIRKKAIADARDFLITTQQKINKELELISKSEKTDKKKEIKSILNVVALEQQQLTLEEKKMDNEALVPLSKPQEGELVWIPEFSGTGRIVSMEKGKITVDINGIFFTTTKNKLFAVSQEKCSAEPVQDAKAGSKQRTKYEQPELKTELKLLGMTFEEALPLVEKFIDSGYLAGLNSLRIVHGKGTGVLRTKIRKYLKGLRFVTEFYSPAQEMGGEGVTVVKFS